MTREAGTTGAATGASPQSSLSSAEGRGEEGRHTGGYYDEASDEARVRLGGIPLAEDDGVHHQGDGHEQVP